MLTDLRGVSKNATPSATSFLFCNYLPDDNVSVTTVHLLTPSNPLILIHAFFASTFAIQIKFVNPVLRQIAETRHQYGKGVWV
jgi:hypothetical protein